jgi:hypothetical protein
MSIENYINVMGCSHGKITAFYGGGNLNRDCAVRYFGAVFSIYYLKLRLERVYYQALMHAESRMLPGIF